MKKRNLLALLLISASLLGGCQNETSSSSSEDISSSEEESSSYVYETSDRYKDIATIYQNVYYGDENRMVENTYKKDGVNYDGIFEPNNNFDYDAKLYRSVFDLYVPDSISKTDKHTVMLFIHGGAWISGSKDDMSTFAQSYVEDGYITATIDYTLLTTSLGDKTKSIFRNLDEIDACIKAIKSRLEELGFDTSKTNLVIGGVSSGAHLTMLYAYSRGDKCPLPISFLIDIIGPTEIKPRAWKKFIDDSDTVVNAGITPEAISVQEANNNLETLTSSYEDYFSYTWTDYMTMYIADGMLGSPFSQSEILTATSNMVNIDMDNEYAKLLVEKGEEFLSPTSHIKDNDYPILMAYAGKDTIIGINQYAQLKTVLDEHGVKNDFVYFPNSDHILDVENNPLAAYSFYNKLTEWLEATLE